MRGVDLSYQPLPMSNTVTREEGAAAMANLWNDYWNIGQSNQILK